MAVVNDEEEPRHHTNEPLKSQLLPDYVMNNGAYIPPQSPIYNEHQHQQHHQQPGQQHSHELYHTQPFHNGYYPPAPQYFASPEPYKITPVPPPPIMSTPQIPAPAVQPIHDQVALKELEFENGFYGNVGIAAQGIPFPIQIQNTAETVIMEVSMGMQISLPNPDGTSQTIHGPSQLRMNLALNAPPPIQAPPNYQIVIRWDVDPESQLPVRIFSVVPLQNIYTNINQYTTQNISSPSGDAYQSGNVPPGFPAIMDVPGQSPNSTEKCVTEGTIQRGGETDEEKNKIKLLLSYIRAPILINVGITWVELRWSSLDKSENFTEPVSYLCEIQCMNKQEQSTSQWEIKYQGRDLSCRIDSLLPGSEYLSRLKARHQNITGNESAAVTFMTLTGKPERPLPPMVSSVTKDKLSIKWKAPSDNGDNIREYTLEMASGAHRSAEMRKIYIGKALAYTIGEKKKEQLRPGTVYRFRIKATNSLGSSPYSNEFQYKTQQPSLPVPENFRVTEITSTSVKVEWCKDQLRQYIYKLQMSDDNIRDAVEQSQSRFKNVYEGKDNSFKAMNLRRATRYRFRLQTTSENGNSPFTSIIEETTNAESPSQLYKPVLKKIWKMDSLEALDEGNQKKPGPFYKAELSWKAPKETGGLAITEYCLQQRIADRNQSWELKYRGSKEYTTVDNLPPGSRIEFRVQAVSPAGASAWSMPELVPTRPGKPKPPKKITIDEVGTTEATISWSVGLCVTGGAVQRYEIKVQNTKQETKLNDLEDDPRIQFKNQDKQARQCTLKDLIPGKSYRVYLRTINSGSIESDWNYQDFETNSDKPSPPDNILVLAVQSQMVSIEWKCPSCNGSTLTGYEVEVCSGESKSIQYTQAHQTSFNHSNLTANTVYTFRVAATNKIGRSDFSPPCPVRTQASSPHIPTLTAKLIYNIPVVRQQALLKWNKPSDQGSEISGYRIECRWASGEAEYNQSRTDAELRIPDLLPSTTYRFRIQAINDFGSSPFTDWTTILSRELPPNPPTLTESEITHNSVKLTWSQTGSKYMLQMFKTNNKNLNSWKDVYRGEKVTYRVSKLVEGSVYRFRISSSNNSGDGHFSPPREIKTLRVSPPQIKVAPTVTIFNNDVTVNWAHGLQGVTLSDLRFNVILMNDSKSIESFETANRELRLEHLTEETNYTVKVCSIRKNVDGDKYADFSPNQSFFIKKVVTPKQPSATVQTSLIALPFNWHDDSVTALLLFLFAILAVLVALCGHHLSEI